MRISAALSSAGSTTYQASAAAGPLTRVVDLALVRATEDPSRTILITAREDTSPASEISAPAPTRSEIYPSAIPGGRDDPAAILALAAAA